MSVMKNILSYVVNKITNLTGKHYDPNTIVIGNYEKKSASVDDEVYKILKIGDYNVSYDDLQNFVGLSDKSSPIDDRADIGTHCHTGEIFNDYAQNEARAEFSHCEGRFTVAAYTASCSHAEGYGSGANGVASHAEGKSTLAIGEGSHSSGIGTIAYNDNMTAIGRYNVNGWNTEDGIIFAIGNGTEETNRSNAFTVDNTGYAKSNADFSDEADITDNTLVTKKYVDTHGGGGSYISKYVESIDRNDNANSIVYKQINGARHEDVSISIEPNRYVKDISLGEDYPNSLNITYKNTTSNINLVGLETTYEEGSTVNTGEIFNSYIGDDKNIASGNYSHASGVGTIAYNDSMTAIGQYNINGSDNGDHLLFAVGNGSDNENRSNAFSVDSSGNAIIPGSVSTETLNTTNINTTTLNTTNINIINSEGESESINNTFKMRVTYSDGSQDVFKILGEKE